MLHNRIFRKLISPGEIGFADPCLAAPPFAPGLMRKFHLEDRKGTGARQIVLERNFPKMGIGDVEVAAADRKTVRPGKF
jgi:hypothetical protein